MSPSSSQRSLDTPGHIADLPGRQRSSRPAAAPKRPLDELAVRRGAGPETSHESIDARDWRKRVGREALHQEVIEATFDRADAYERLGDFGRALEWLDRAAALGGGLPPAYRTRRARCVRAAERRPGPIAGGWKDNPGRSEQAQPAG
jgi:hypothetical protein